MLFWTNKVLNGLSYSKFETDSPPVYESRDWVVALGGGGQWQGLISTEGQNRRCSHIKVWQEKV